MEIIEIASGLKKPVIVRPVEDKDFKVLTEKQYSFDWKLAKDSANIYKLHIEEEETILGVMGLTNIPTDKRIEITLLASSIDNQGKTKKYGRIAGCLIAFACQLAVDIHGDDACTSLIPKSELVKHYMQAYYMHYGGKQLYLEGAALKKLLNEYL